MAFCILQLSIRNVLDLVNLANQSLLSQCQNARLSDLISRSKSKGDTGTVTSTGQTYNTARTYSLVSNNLNGPRQPRKLSLVCLTHSEAAFVIAGSHLPQFPFPTTPNERPERATGQSDEVLEDVIKVVEWATGYPGISVEDWTGTTMEDPRVHSARLRMIVQGKVNNRFFKNLSEKILGSANHGPFESPPKESKDAGIGLAKCEWGSRVNGECIHLFGRHYSVARSGDVIEQACMDRLRKDSGLAMI